MQKQFWGLLDCSCLITYAVTNMIKDMASDYQYDYKHNSSIFANYIYMKCNEIYLKRLVDIYICVFPCQMLMDLDCSLQFADSICQIHPADDGIESDDDCVDGDDDNNANILYLRLLVVGGQWSLIADTQVMSSHSYLDSLLHSQMKVIQVQNYNISEVFSVFDCPNS